jgi:hypothetical protein
MAAVLDDVEPSRDHSEVTSNEAQRIRLDVRGVEMEQSIADLEELVVDSGDPRFSDEELLVHAWRTDQLERLGMGRVDAAALAWHVDWHDVAKLVERGCPCELALEIVR